MTQPDRSGARRDAAHEALRELIPDLIQDLIGSYDLGAPEDHSARNVHASISGDGPANGRIQEKEIVPLVPAPPVAAVLRPSSWRGPVKPGEVIVGGDGLVAPAVESTTPPAESPGLSAAARTHGVHTSAPTPDSSLRVAKADFGDAAVEAVRIDSDEDLQAFVRSLVTRLESPRDRLAIKAGRLRFHLHRTVVADGSPGAAAGGDAEHRVRVEKGAATERHVREAAARRARLVLARGAVLTPLARDCARSLGVQIERDGKC